MSRLYEALKGASRTRGKDHEEFWQALDINGMEVLSAESDIQVSPGQSPFTIDGDSSDQASQAIAQTVDDEQQVRSEFATETKVGLNRYARLLPYAANSNVADHYRRLRTKILQQREAKPFDPWL